MSRFLSGAAGRLAPYIPGEQPRDQQYVKLNTNESPYPPCPGVRRVLESANAADLRLYPDPDVIALRQAMADCYGLSADQVFAGGGSDEVLGFFFMAFFDRGDKVYYPDITYGFYAVYTQLCGLEGKTIPLREDYSLAPEDYFGLDGNIVIANPNAPTGMAISPAQVELILQNNPQRLVLVDEAYIDFAKDQTCVPLLAKYDNLLVVQTYSKSRALAGMRIGCGLGAPEVIGDLRRIKYSFNPYNLDRLSILIGIAASAARDYLQEITGKIAATRDETKARLEQLGFTVLPSKTNFLFARSPVIGGYELYRRLKEKGVLVRQFEKDRIRDFVRITVGTPEQMDRLIEAIGEL